MNSVAGLQMRCFRAIKTAEAFAKGYGDTALNRQLAGVATTTTTCLWSGHFVT
jgi:hypothetical protein